MRPLLPSSWVRSSCAHPLQPFRPHVDVPEPGLIIVRAAVLVSRSAEPQAEFSLPIAIALLGDIDDDSGLFPKFLKLDLCCGVALFCRLGNSPDLVFLLAVPPYPDDVEGVRADLRSALDVLGLWD